MTNPLRGETLGDIEQEGFTTEILAWLQARIDAYRANYGTGEHLHLDTRVSELEAVKRYIKTGDGDETEL
jgi:hypothetical protein